MHFLGILYITWFIFGNIWNNQTSEKEGMLCIIVIIKENGIGNQSSNLGQTFCIFEKKKWMHVHASK